jgi:hypothetical protein
VPSVTNQFGYLSAMLWLALDSRYAVTFDSGSDAL